MKKDEVKAYSWVIRGSQRVQILKVMNKPLTPTQVKKLTGLALNNVSDNLRLFAENNIAKCLNEKETLGRIYVLTPIGEKTRRMLKDN